MIPLVEEPKEYYQQFRIYENCYFGCRRTTRFWHAGTNQPICQQCAKTRNVSEVKKCTPNYKPKTKAEYTSHLTTE